MIRYEPFYRKHGVLRRENFASPPATTTLNVEFPTGSVFHYLPESPSDTGPDENWWMIRNIEQGDKYVRHLDEMVTEYGTVRREASGLTTKVSAYHRLHREMRRITSMSAVLNNVQSTMLVNYGLMQQFYKYGAARNLEFQRNANLRKTFWKQVDAIAQEIDRQHFVQIHIPSRLPTLEWLVGAERRWDQTAVQRFTSIENQFILDLWLWFGGKREESVISNLSEQARRRLNFVFMNNGYFYVLNLNTVEAFRKSEENPKGSMEPMQMQRRFLRAIMDLVGKAFAASEASEKLAKKPELGESLTGSTGSELVEESSLDSSSNDNDFWNDSEPSEKTTKANPLSGLSLTAPTLPQPESKSPQSRSSVGSSPAKSRLKQTQDSAQDDVLDALGETPMNEPEVVEELSDEEIDKDLAALAEVSLVQSTELINSIVNPHEDPLSAGILNRAKALAKEELISGAEYRRLENQAERYKQIKNPFGPGLLHEAIQVTPEELNVEPRKFNLKDVRVFDESMLQSSHPVITAKYVNETMHKHIAGMVLSAQRAGVVIQDYQLEKSESAAGATETTRVKLAPIGGAPSTYVFTHPTVNEDGTFKTGGTRYRLSWQRGDLPIRKVNPHRVVLTSFYGKIAVVISDRSVFNYGRWLTTQIMAASMEEGGLVKNVRTTNVFDQELHAPKAYSLLSRVFHTLEVGDIKFNFKHEDIEKMIMPEALKKLEVDGSIVAGTGVKGNPVVFNKDGIIETIGSDGKVVHGTFEELSGIDRSKAPTECAMMKVLGQQVGVGVAMAFYVGLTNLIRLLGVEHRRVLQGDRLNLQPEESTIRFSDETLVYSTRDIKASLILSGFKFYHNQIRQMSIYAFDRRDAFVDLLDVSARNTRYTGELILLNDMFVDPITEDLLTQMKEPTRWFPLLMRSVELLTTEYSPDEMDGSQMVFRGYHRFAGAVYKELVQGIRTYNQRSKLSKTGIDIKPTAVWSAISNDPSVRQYDDINPIQQLRSDEIATYIGQGGRSKRTMVARTRRMHKNDVGTVSEAGVDSGDVGINIYLSADPKIINTHGVTRVADPDKDGPGSILSTSAMLSPGADIDDPKRVNFISIQHGSGISAVGYKAMPFRTGYDTVLAHRVGKKYSYVAKGEGEVISIKGGVLKVRYDDGSVDAVEIGRQYTSGAGHLYPNDLVTTVKQGDHVSDGDVLVYNSGFFERDYFSPRQVVYKAGVLVRTVLLEALVTHEDSSSFSLEVSKKLRSYETEVRNITLPFNTSVSKLVVEGQKVEVDSILCVLEDSTIEAAGLFDEKTVDTLSLLANQSPRAKVAGQVDKIEVLYNGDLEDMSVSLRDLAEASDANFARVARGLGKGPTTGRVFEDMRVEGNSLQIDTLVIRVYITHGNDAFTGDKATFANQMKSVAGGVMIGINETESGLPLGAKFSDKSNDDRLVRSSRKMGMYNSLLLLTGRRTIAAYRGK